MHSLYGYIEFVSRQIFAVSAEGAYLERRASEYGIYRRKATSAEGTITFSGTGTVPIGTVLQTADDIQYETTSVNEASGAASIQAIEAGASGNIPAGTILSLASPVVGIENEAVSGAVSGGSDIEDDESLRSRLLYRMRNPPKAGTKTDYIAWAQEVSGVTRAWCYPLELGPGHVTVRFMTDGATDDGIPSEVMVERVREHIETLMPVTTILTVVAPVAKPLDMTLDILPDNPEIRTKIASAVRQIIQIEAEPAIKILLTSLNRAVASVEEVTSFRILSPTDDVAAATGEILVPGTISYE
ncbi:baseplate J/gp47 family protein [uncultured Parasutterella sp.]|uniref:baseplate J/gp47 family protein n=1 Tax=uncultured Parasutterella sp. TaxID=1263098 RepID=UPI002599E55D|nr:baseplate J/gp47 family protein [uncultured Parasutterella sp.]